VSAQESLWRATCEKWWDDACRHALPRALDEASGCDLPAADEVGADIATRGWSLARCGSATREVLTAPFLEEAVAHPSRIVPLDGRAASIAVVRNSLVERERVRGTLTDSDIWSVLKVMSTFLWMFLGHEPEPGDEGGLDDAFAGLPGRCPRAWGAFAALYQVVEQGGGSAGFRVHVLGGGEPAVPELPAPDEIAPAAADAPRQADGGDQLPLFNLDQLSAQTQSDDGEHPSDPDGVPVGTGVRGPLAGSGLDPLFDPRLVRRLARLAAGRDQILAVPLLSAISRRYDMLFRVIDFVLAHGMSVLTANYLLAPGEVHVRGGGLVVPGVGDPVAVLGQHRGLTARHRAAAREALAMVADRH
jgi:hypothetical protein